MPEYMDWIGSAFRSPDDGDSGRGITPVVFDIIAPDRVKSLLPDDLKLVLHVNPNSMSIQRTKLVERIQTLGGYVEQHWGDAPTEVSFEASTGGFMRLHNGMVSSTNADKTAAAIRPMSMQPNMQRTNSARRETIAYDKYLDLLALFHNNGNLYDRRGNVVETGQIKMTFDGHSFYGWFRSFSVTDTAEQPYSFNLSAQFVVERESHRLYSVESTATDYAYTNAEDPEAWWE